MTITSFNPALKGWRLGSTLPAGWADILRDMDGGFFHSPLGLRLGAPRGTPIYALYHTGSALAGIAVGVRTAAWPGGRNDDAYFPTWPAFRNGVDRTSALAALRGSLRAAGIATVRWDSFDAGVTSPTADSATRCEYLIDLTKLDDQLSWPPSAPHRRAVERGTREGWRCVELHGEQATATLSQVMDQVVRRARARGSRMTMPVQSMVAVTDTKGSGWGVSTYAAMSGETVLGAILVGWTRTRAYYLLGGTTEEGHGRGASVWLHAMLASRLAADGMRCYNLGGVVATGSTPIDPAFGLHRFKEGFGTIQVPCAGDRWLLTGEEPVAATTAGGEWGTRWAV